MRKYLVPNETVRFGEYTLAHGTRTLFPFDIQTSVVMLAHTEAPRDCIFSLSAKGTRGEFFPPRECCPAIHSNNSIRPHEAVTGKPVPTTTDSVAFEENSQHCKHRINPAVLTLVHILLQSKKNE